MNVAESLSNRAKCKICSKTITEKYRIERSGRCFYGYPTLSFYCLKCGEKLIQREIYDLEGELKKLAKIEV